MPIKKPVCFTFPFLLAKVIKDMLDIQNNDILITHLDLLIFVCCETFIIITAETWSVAIPKLFQQKGEEEGHTVCVRSM
jgi:hypothetical protein